jgi:hypothetical protein
MTMNASRIAHITATCLSEAEYRGFTLRTERMGHTNVMTDAGFYGGYPTVAAAERRVDEIIQRANTTVERVPLADGRVAYRVHIPELGA